jgi:hypothetical protein
MPGRDSRLPVLLVTCETSWLAPTRMPAALHRAGFEVTLLCPPGALALLSPYVVRTGELRADANPREWLFALAATVKAAQPLLILPGCEMSLRLLQDFVLALRSISVKTARARSRNSSSDRWAIPGTSG